MPPKRDSNKPKVPDVPWAENDHHLTWQLLGELEKPENFKVLFGKREKTENTSGETKVKVYKRIGQILLPKLFEIDGGVVGDRVKSKLESLTKSYRKQAERLRQTGGGLENDGDQDESVTTMDFYISGSGPDASTPEAALNLWQAIEKDFPFFPRLHRIFASRPNVTPICATTALGPNGRSTVWYQPPTPLADDQIDPTLRTSHPLPPNYISVRSDEALTPANPRIFGGDASAVLNTTNRPSPAPETPRTGVENTPLRNRQPKPSSCSVEAIQKARATIQVVPKKRTLTDAMLDIQRENLDALRNASQEKLNIKKRAQLLEEFKLGIWTKDQYIQQIKKLNGDTDDLPPSKRQNTREFSPDWDIQDGDFSEEDNFSQSIDNI